MPVQPVDVKVIVLFARRFAARSRCKLTCIVLNLLCAFLVLLQASARATDSQRRVVQRLNQQREQRAKLMQERKTTLAQHVRNYNERD